MKQPLFASLLESQSDLEQVAAGSSNVSAPNMRDDLITNPLDDGFVVTLRYPSDSDELDPTEYPEF